VRLITAEQFERRALEALLLRLHEPSTRWKHFAPEPPMGDPYACADPYALARRTAADGLYLKQGRFAKQAGTQHYEQ
jgi:hypothetical protein